jgi:N-carbamoylputrescine amidase
MSRIVKCAVTQAEGNGTKQQIIDKHLGFVEQAAKQGVNITCFQEVFFGPYFCQIQDKKWYDYAEPIPGPTITLMQEVAKQYGMALIVPIYEVLGISTYYNSSAVIDADGTLLGLYRKNHIPHVVGFWEKYYFKPGNLGYPVFQTQFGKIGVYTCYDRHFPEGGRMLGLHGAEIVFIPSATSKGHSDYLWFLEQRALAVANGYFVGTNNRVGVEPEFGQQVYYGSSYFCDPRGQILAQGSDDKEEVVIADLNLDLIKEVRDHWQFYRDRRPETYGEIVGQLP